MKRNKRGPVTNGPVLLVFPLNNFGEFTFIAATFIGPLRF